MFINILDGNPSFDRHIMLTEQLLSADTALHGLQNPSSLLADGSPLAILPSLDDVNDHINTAYILALFLGDREAIHAACLLANRAEIFASEKKTDYPRPSSHR